MISLYIYIFFFKNVALQHIATTLTSLKKSKKTNCLFGIKIIPFNKNRISYSII